MSRVDGRPKRQKLAAVLAADMVGVVAAAEQSGIPESTIRYWAQKPEFAEYRAKARQDLVDEVGVVAHLAWRRVAEALLAGTMEPRDALSADKATSLYQLVTGEATQRTESRELTEGLDDHERATLRKMLEDELAKVES
jgi:hypothetical protein